MRRGPRRVFQGAKRNAATLVLLGGDGNRASALAWRVLELLGAEADSYHVAATEAEAHLLLGDADAARSALERAAELHNGDYGAVSTTRRQLRLVCGVRVVDTTCSVRSAAQESCTSASARPRPGRRGPRDSRDALRRYHGFRQAHRRAAAAVLPARRWQGKGKAT
jgi:hypothetical protein